MIKQDMYVIINNTNMYYKYAIFNFSEEYENVGNVYEKYKI
jgi:hypothetical protein